MNLDTRFHCHQLKNYFLQRATSREGRGAMLPVASLVDNERCTSPQSRNWLLGASYLAYRIKKWVSLWSSGYEQKKAYMHHGIWARTQECVWVMKKRGIQRGLRQRDFGPLSAFFLNNIVQIRNIPIVSGLYQTCLKNSDSSNSLSIHYIYEVDGKSMKHNP